MSIKVSRSRSQQLASGLTVWVWDSDPKYRVKAVYVRESNRVHLAKPVNGLFQDKLTEWKHASPVNSIN